MRGRIRLFPWELESMGEYSCSLPTATTLFKTWKRDRNAFRVGAPNEPSWVVGRFVADTPERKDSVAILWMEVDLLHGPKPQRYDEPDWDNYQRWRREEEERRKAS